MRKQAPPVMDMKTAWVQASSEEKRAFLLANMGDWELESLGGNTFKN